MHRPNNAPLSHRKRCGILNVPLKRQCVALTSNECIRVLLAFTLLVALRATLVAYYELRRETT